MNFQTILKSFDYTFPKELVALEPSTPRDAARLLVHERQSGKTLESTFAQLADFVPPNAVLVFNQTKVLPARVAARKSTGGKVELLYLGQSGDLIRTLCNKKLEVGDVLDLSNAIKLKVCNALNGEYFFECSFGQAQFLKFLQEFGQIPLPPYLKHSSLSEKKRRVEYQTIFGKKPGAVAAPTASLHFTERLMKKLADKGVQVCFVTLHVGLGTFATLSEEQVKFQRLHKEYFEIDKSTAQVLNLAKKQGKRIIAVGTTVVRTLESASDDHGVLVRLSGETDIFIQEKTRLKFVDDLVTNFHVPKSSLLMLVAAFVGRDRLMSLYKFAVQKKYRLFSFGDGMYIK